jgi:mono/diheme cytochrome c family protein
MTIAALGFSVVLILYSIPTSQHVVASQDQGYVEKGQKLFRQYCAVCHGVEAKGNGPAAAELKKQPADLTVIQKRGEKFPTYRIMTWIDGEKAVPAHGTREMPIWGTVFRRTKGETAQHGEIYALMKYVESVQKYRQ